jgi:fermentation-respiration switch protein FrsA (DUF1100 family)
LSIEQRVLIANEIAGIVTVPEEGAVVPAVLLLHGFGNQKDEVGDLYKRLAQLLAAKGIGSLRFDFHGWGESSGDMADTTIEQQVNDAGTAYDYLVGLDFVEPARIGVVGSRVREWRRRCCLPGQMGVGRSRR